jgi:hypothetical protein
MLPFHDTSYYTDPGTAGPILSAFTAVAVGLVGFFALLVVALRNMLQAAMGARAWKVAETDAENRKLVPGYAILHGQVETGDALPAVSVRIHQGGTLSRYRDGALHHRWDELDRRIDARPFFLRLASGERVEVVPGDDVFLVAALGVEPGGGGERPQGEDERFRTAKLSHSDLVYACGRLAPAVPGVARRGAEDGYSLHPHQGKMLLSTERLEDRFVRRARFHKRWLLACVAAFLFTNGVLFGEYWLELGWGRPVVAHTIGLSSWSGRRRAHYLVRVEVTLDDGRSSRGRYETSYAFYQWAKIGDPLPCLVVPFHPSTNDIGTQPTLGNVTCILAWVLLGGFAVGYSFRTSRARPWYERKKVTDFGEGPLGSPDDPS